MNTKVEEALGVIPHNRANATPPPESIREFLSYCPATGVFSRQKAPPHRAGGLKCGNRRPSGYMAIIFKGKHYYAHRLAWWWVHGEMPAMHIDHINGDKADNRISNLRLSTFAQNNFNAPVGPRNTSGFRGVTWEQRSLRYVAKIYRNGKCKHIGQFRTKEEAAAAYAAESEKVAGQFEHPSVTAVRINQEQVK